MVASVPVETSRTISTDGQRADDALGELDLFDGRRAEALSARRGGADRRHHRGMAVAEDHRSVAADVVDVAAAVGRRRARRPARCG